MKLRQCRVVRGSRERTEREAAALVPFDRVHIGPPSLGTTWDAVVLDLHDGLDADVLFRSMGAIRAGGALILRMPTQPVPLPKLAVFPYSPDDVGHRFWRRLEGLLPDAHGPIGPPPPFEPDTREQDALLEQLDLDRPGATVLVAPRGRGKSAALGRAVRGRDAVVTSRDPRMAAEVVAFGDVPWVAPTRIPDDIDVLVVDEAAALPVPLLQRLARRARHVAFVTTCDGYEGTGGGFVLRFLPWLRDHVDVVEHTLDTPIRFARDGLEDLGERLLDDPVYTLLRRAHYRTVPSDFQRMLDAPNLEVLTLGDAPDAATLIAHEGGLPPTAGRVAGHALADTLLHHAGRPDAAAMRIVRSVRIAVRADRRRRGLATQLVARVHERPADLFGTLFGAEPGVVRFRRSVGYELVRVGVAAGSRTGMPTAVMVRAACPEAEALVRDLRGELARDLPVQLELLAADTGLPVHPPLLEALLADLPAPNPLDDSRLDAILAGYFAGHRHYEAAATAIERVCAGVHSPLIDGRVHHRRGWREVAADVGLGVPGAMRALRREVRALVERLGGVQQGRPDPEPP